MSTTVEGAKPLDDLMLAMDVVDTLRHEQNLVNRELDEAGREAELLEKLRAIYRQQGIDVPDRILREGVAALRESRFVYDPPKPSFRTSLLQLYVSRSKWGRWVLAVLIALAIGLGGYFGVYRPISLAAGYVAALLRRMDACRMPIIARVNGPALAGGFGIMCACDLVVAREDARLGVTEVKVGIFPMMILPYLLRIVSYRRLMELCITGELITGKDAAAENIVNYAVPYEELDQKLDWLLARVTDKSPTGIRLGKQALAKIREMSTDAALEYAQFMLANMTRTKDAREGMLAFNEKRAPNWTAE